MQLAKNDVKCASRPNYVDSKEKDVSVTFTGFIVMYINDTSQYYLFYIYNHTFYYSRFIARIINIESVSSHFITGKIYDSFL